MAQYIISEHGISKSTQGLDHRRYKTTKYGMGSNSTIKRKTIDYISEPYNKLWTCVLLQAIADSRASDEYTQSSNVTNLTYRDKLQAIALFESDDQRLKDHLDELCGMADVEVCTILKLYHDKTIDITDLMTEVHGQRDGEVLAFAEEGSQKGAQDDLSLV